MVHARWGAAAAARRCRLAGTAGSMLAIFNGNRSRPHLQSLRFRVAACFLPKRRPSVPKLPTPQPATKPIYCGRALEPAHIDGGPRRCRHRRRSPQLEPAAVHAAADWRRPVPPCSPSLCRGRAPSAMRVCENCRDYMYPNSDEGRSAKYCSACKVVTCEREGRADGRRQRLVYQSGCAAAGMAGRALPLPAVARHVLPPKWPSLVHTMHCRSHHALLQTAPSSARRATGPCTSGSARSCGRRPRTTECQRSRCMARAVAGAAAQLAALAAAAVQPTAAAVLAAAERGRRGLCGPCAACAATAR